MQDDVPPDLPTELAAALARLGADPDDQTARLAFHTALSGAELVMWLEAEASDMASLSPRVFDLETGPTVLAFDTEAALAGFAGQPVPYAALPGRVLVAMLNGAVPPLSLLVQAENGAAELLDPAALSWLTQTLSAPAPEVTTGQARSFWPPALASAVTAVLVPALERRLSGVPGLDGAVLARVDWSDGGSGHVLALAGLPDEARPPVSRAVAEALALSGVDLDGLDVIFPSAAQMGVILAAGLSLNPAPFVPPTAPEPPSAPGMDPDRPPRLR